MPRIQECKTSMAAKTVMEKAISAIGTANNAAAGGSCSCTGSSGAPVEQEAGSKEAAEGDLRQ